jgi:hypothetical protein
MTDICTACQSNPPYVPGMSLCRACLRAKVESDRLAREARWSRQREKAAEEKVRRDWQAPLTDPEGMQK